MQDTFAQQPFGTPEFADNPSPRCACLVLADTSGSMAGERIAALNSGLELLRAELCRDHLSAQRVEIAVVSFGGTVAVEQPFTTPDELPSITLRAAGGTPMGEAVCRGIEMVNDRKSVYRANGVPYYRPWIFLLTDGAPTDSWSEAAKLVAAGEASKAFLFFAVGVEDADMAVLSKLSVRTPLQLKGLSFREMFSWLSSSLTQVSASRTDEAVKLGDPTGPAGWATTA